MFFTQQLKARARIFRPTTSDGSSLPAYAEVLDAAGGPLPIPCRVEETAARSQDNQKTDQTADGTMIYVLDELGRPDVHLSDLIVVEAGDGYPQRKFKIIRMEKNRGLGMKSRAARLTLSRSTVKTPEVKAHGE